MGEIGKDIATILGAIVGLAVLATLVSKNANTTGVINSTSSFFNSALGTAEGPVTGYSPGPPIYASSGTGISSSGTGLLEPGAAFTGGQW
jgi:hypothetical protein